MQQALASVANKTKFRNSIKAIEHFIMKSLIFSLSSAAFWIILCGESWLLHGNDMLLWPYLVWQYALRHNRKVRLSVVAFNQINKQFEQRVCAHARPDITILVDWA